jgi:hypothetical protein
LQVELVDHEAHPGSWQHYRLELAGTSGELLTNPIYVAPFSVRNAGPTQRLNPTFEKTVRM